MEIKRNPAVRCYYPDCFIEVSQPIAGSYRNLSVRFLDIKSAEPAGILESGISCLFLFCIRIVMVIELIQ